ncbi:hypothetical protein UCRPA7_4495 [Phaeoacremonium minimum UCRPA7]|uniref:F-box domain-containing protein n=1 Tax=Phaeoacremonium minimum (strain UCR-PA7) TaxID=1286976 RepID=R8BKX8_PHAM7|nr:hypothetical protein UCRPA7_4495 [Phaeoacremonium minimum UCRPA7]EOO00066.1 hypothetical protein UCRPA7_4495 [Phaeoacremonium minimum UCRPA7]
MAEINASETRSILDLPPEILDRIAGLVRRGPVRVCLAATCRRFQLAVEPQTFRELSIRSDAIDETDRAGLLEEMQRNGQRGRPVVFIDVMTRERVGYLKALRLDILLSEYVPARRLVFEFALDRKLNSQIFASALERLFKCLNQLTEGDEQVCPKMSFTINDICSPSDSYTVTWNNGTTQVTHWRSVFNTRRYRFSYLDIPIIDPKVIAPPPCISRLTVHTGHRNVGPGTMIRLVGAFENLKMIDLVLPDDERHYIALRRWNRIHLAQDLFDDTMSRHAKVAIELKHDSPKDQAWIGPDLVSPWEWDPVCGGLRHFTDQVAEFSYTGLADPSLLWPMGQVDPTPFWQNLRRLSIYFDCLTPRGNYYFNGRGRHRAENTPKDYHTKSPWLTWREVPPGYHPHDFSGMIAMTAEQNERLFGHPNPTGNRLRWFDMSGHTFDENQEQEVTGRGTKRQFRAEPDWEMLEPLVTAFARACTQMPALVYAKMKTITALRGHGNWGIIYTAPGETCPFDREMELVEDMDSRRLSRRLLYCIGCVKKASVGMAVAMRESLREIGKAQYGGVIQEVLVDPDCSAHKDVTVGGSASDEIVYHFGPPEEDDEGPGEETVEPVMDDPDDYDVPKVTHERLWRPHFGPRVY